MSQLQELEKLYAKKKTILIPKKIKEGESQASLEVKPLSLDEMSCFDMKEGMPLDEMAKNAIKMLANTLGVSEAEAGKIQFKHMMEILDVIVEINDLPEDQSSKIDKVKNFMADKQKAKEVTVDGSGQDKPTQE